MKRFINGKVDSSMSNNQKSELPDSKSVWIFVENVSSRVRIFQH